MHSKPGFSRPCRCPSHPGGHVDRSIAPLRSRQATDLLEDIRENCVQIRGEDLPDARLEGQRRTTAEMGRHRRGVVRMVAASIPVLSPPGALPGHHPPTGATPETAADK